MVIRIEVNNPIIALEGPEKPNLELGVGGGIHNLGFPFRYFQWSFEAVFMTAVNDLDLAVGKQAVFSRRTGTSFLKPGWVACDLVPYAEVSV